MKKFLTATLAIILLIACSKEKKALKHLPGEWDMIGWVVDSSGVEINLFDQLQSDSSSMSLSIDFSDCNAGETCEAITTITVSVMGMNMSLPDTATYSVSSDGEYLLLDGDTNDIIELGSSSMSIGYQDSDGYNTMSFEKM